MTQEDLADRCGLSKTYVARLELASPRRRENPTVEVLDKLAQVLECEAADLLAGQTRVATKRAKAKEQSKLLVECASGINSEHLGLLIELARALRKIPE